MADNPGVSCNNCAAHCRDEDIPADCEDGACHACDRADDCTKEGVGECRPCPIGLTELDQLAGRSLALHAALAGPLARFAGYEDVRRRYGATWEELQLAAFIEDETLAMSPNRDDGQQAAQIIQALMGKR